VKVQVTEIHLNDCKLSPEDAEALVGIVSRAVPVQGFGQAYIHLANVEEQTPSAAEAE
jgi:hypothetical protein